MSKKSTRILIVDDEEIVRESLSGWLEKDGYTIGTAPDGATALKVMGEHPWSILLVDLKMPGIDGLEVLRRVKERWPETAVLIMTAYATVDTAVNAMKTGAFDYVVKPFDPEEVSLVVEKIVAQQALVRENVILRKALKKEYRFHDLVTKSPALLATLELAKTAAKSPSTVLIMTAYATVDTAVNAMKAGAFDYVVKPFDPEEVSLVVEKIVAQQALVRENVILRKALKKEYRFHDLVTKSPALLATLELAKTAAKSPSTVLILGESGTGKELLARAIHAESPRVAKPFVAVSCAALTETLLESELFGYEKGAFTGANGRREGKFEAADGGTLFLDEIGDISPKLQLDLLRVLEERRVTRVGGTDSVGVDVRIIAATNRDLRRAVDEGRFRQDLFYRLNVITITLVPLRDRKEDIPLLVDRFLEQLSSELKREVEGVSPEAMAILLAHTWPGNVRELRNVLERAIVVSDGPVLSARHLGLTLETGAPAPEHPASLEEIERQHIGAVLRQTAGNVTQAARILDIDRVTLYAKIRKYGLKRAEDGEFEPATPAR
ncbi:MAG TPA: sigma 54-interacting transcriptional regulator [Thermoanaerobaculia bacterium]|nr:sigma 54-interacting transcriptional regulator [Thermoanaerobaculia bacterium]